MIDKEKEILLKEFGGNVRRIREEKSLSLRTLSYACNIDNSKISKIELGKTNITILTVIDLAVGLGVSPARLLNFMQEDKY